MIASSCTQGIFSSPWGSRTLSTDTLNYDQTIISSIKNLSSDASGNKLLQNMVGEYNGLSSKFTIKFTNFKVLNDLSDSIDFEMNEANIAFYKTDYWGNEAFHSFRVNMIDTDSSLYWTDDNDVDDTFSNIEDRTTFYYDALFSVDDDSIFIPIDPNIVGDWHQFPDSLYVNNGLTITPADNSLGMMGFYSANSTGDYRPRLLIDCTLRDTNGVYLQDSTFTIYAGGDLMQTENVLSLDDDLFYIAQGNIHRSYIMLDSLRADTLLGPTDLLNKAILRFTIDDSLSMLSEDDTLQIAARLFRSDFWENDSISYNYTAYSNVIRSINDTVKINIAQLVQYLVSNPKEYAYEGIFFYLNSENYDFNRLLIDPDETSLDIVYTKVNNE